MLRAEVADSLEDLGYWVLFNPLYGLAVISVLTAFAFRRRPTWLGRLRYPLAGAVVLGCTLSTPGIANALVKDLERNYPPVANPALAGDGDGPLIVVLSSGTLRDENNELILDAVSRERASASVRLWRQIGGELLFVGATSRARVPAAQQMADLVISIGVPPSAIRVETQSRNTYENLLFSRERIASHASHVWLVTSAMHMRRAMAVGRKLGLQLRPFACDWREAALPHLGDWVPRSVGPSMFLEPLHEILGLAYYRLMGYAD